MRQLFTRAFWTLINWDTWLTSWVCSFCLLWRHTNRRPSAPRLSRGWRTMSLPGFEVKLALSALAHQFTSSSSSCLPHWRRRALEVWNWWRCACENVSGASLASEREREREIKRKRVHFGVEGVTDRSGKSAFSWTLNCKMEEPGAKQWSWSIGYGERLLINAPVPAWACWKREKRKKKEGVAEIDTDTDEVCVTIGLGKGSQRGREQKELM